MKKIIFLFFLMFFCAYFVTGLYAFESDLEKQGSIVKAINEKPDLTGEDKDSIKLMFGYPVFRKKIPQEDKEKSKEKEISARIVTGKKKGKAEEKKEIWIYRPFDYGEDQITITFTDGLVSDVKYEK